MKKENWIKSPWTISIVTALISFLLTITNDYFKEKPILTTILTILKWTGSLIWSILDFSIKIWWIIIFILFLIVILFLYDKFSQTKTFKPDFYDYREDKFKKWKWSWSWEWNHSKNAWIISNLKAHCPNCNTPMIENSTYHGLSFDCPRCDYYARDSQCDEPHKVERIILDNIDRKRKTQKTKE